MGGHGAIRPRGKECSHPLDLEIIDRVYEAAWAQLEAREPFRDRAKDGERGEALRQRIFAVASSGKVDFDSQRASERVHVRYAYRVI